VAFEVELSLGGVDDRFDVLARSGLKNRAERALSAHDCRVVSDRGPLTKWSCPCGRHSANVPRHVVVSPGVVADTIRRMECLPKGWLQ
jgi:hypothetical protein